MIEQELEAAKEELAKLRRRVKHDMVAYFGALLVGISLGLGPLEEFKVLRWGDVKEYFWPAPKPWTCGYAASGGVLIGSSPNYVWGCGTWDVAYVDSDLVVYQRTR